MKKIMLISLLWLIILNIFWRTVPLKAQGNPSVVSGVASLGNNGNFNVNFGVSFSQINQVRLCLVFEGDLFDPGESYSISNFGGQGNLDPVNSPPQTHATLFVSQNPNVLNQFLSGNFSGAFTTNGTMHVTLMFFTVYGIPNSPVPPNGILQYPVNITINGPVPVGNTASQFFSIKNSGFGNLVVVAIRPRPYDILQFPTTVQTQFSLINPPAFPLILPPGASQQINAQFAPTVVGNTQGLIEIFVLNDPATCEGAIKISAQGAPSPNPVILPPPFTYDKPLPKNDAHICLPPFMVQDPFKKHTWWARSTGNGNLEIILNAMCVNPSETGSATIKVFDSTNVLVGTATIVHPTITGAENSSTPVVIPSPSSGSLYRIDVSVAPPPPPPNAPARHYRLVLKGASLLGANSPLQAQAEHAEARWGINVVSGEDLDAIVVPGPEAGTTTGVVEIRNPTGALITSAGIGIPINLVNPGNGIWELAIRGLDGHYIVNKTSGADRGIYVTWMTWGFGNLSGSITLDGNPNTVPVNVEVNDALTNAPVDTVIGVTSSYQFFKLPVGSYSVRVVVPGSLPPAEPAQVIVTITCEDSEIANFNIPNPNKPPHCEDAVPSISEIWPPNHKMVDISILGVTDPDGDPITINVTKITQDEPVNTLGDGNFEPDGAGLGTSVAQVRAERSGTPRVPGNSRVYVISFTADDGNGGMCEGSVRVCVPHDQRRGHTCIDDGQFYDSVTGAYIGFAPKVASSGEGENSQNISFGISNFPNPFNPSTTIQYSTPEASQVRLSIYNILGQVVRELVNGQHAAGSYTVQWDGRDALGNVVSSGIYIYQLKAGRQTAVRKMIFSK